MKVLLPAATGKASGRSRSASPALEPNSAHLQRLAEFRFQLRRFLHFSQTVVEEAGLRNQQYQILQCVGGMPEGLEPTIANVAARMLLKHNSAVELVDRTIEKGLLRRVVDPGDHRRILLHVTPQGQRMLASLAEFHTRELEHSGPGLVSALQRVLEAGPSRARRVTASSPTSSERRKAGAL